MSNHFVGHISFFNSYLENTIENQNMVKYFLRQVKAQYPEVLTIDDSDISNMPFFQGCDTVHTMPIPLNCEITILQELKILQLSDLETISDKIIGLSCRISGKYLSFSLEEIRRVDTIETLNKIEGYYMWTGTDSKLFHMTESNMDMRTSFIPYTAQHINEIDEDYFYYDFNTVYGIDIFLKAMFTSIYDDIVDYHMEKLIPIPSAILDIISSEYLESDDKLQDFLLLAKEIFNKYAHTNFVPESIQLITLTGNGYDIELFHKNFSKSLNYMMQELISEASNYLII
jgi:hypothetical protein